MATDFSKQGIAIQIKGAHDSSFYSQSRINMHVTKDASDVFLSFEYSIDKGPDQKITSLAGVTFEGVQPANAAAMETAIKALFPNTNSGNGGSGAVTETKGDTATRLALTPIDGDRAYDTTTKSWWYWNNTQWVEM